MAQSQLCSFLPSMQLSRKQFYGEEKKREKKEGGKKWLSENKRRTERTLFEPPGSTTGLRRQWVGARPRVYRCA